MSTQRLATRWHALAALGWAALYALAVLAVPPDFGGLSAALVLAPAIYLGWWRGERAAVSISAALLLADGLRLISFGQSGDYWRSGGWAVALTVLAAAWLTGRWRRENAERHRSEQTLREWQDQLDSRVAERTEALAARERHYRVVLDLASDAIFVASPTGVYEEVNERACELTGYSRDELLTMRVTDLVAPEDLAVQPIRTAELQTGRTVLTERRLARKDGTRVAIEVHARMLPDRRIQAIVRDITPRRQAEAERMRWLAQAQRRLKEMEAIHEVSTVVRAAARLDEMLPRLLDKTLEVLDCATGGVRLYDGATDDLRRVVVRGWMAGLPASQRPREGLAGHVFTTGETLVAPDMRANSLTLAESLPSIPANWGCALVPIRAQAEIVGVLYVGFESSREFLPDELRLLATLAEIAGSAIHRAGLYEQLEHHADDLERRVGERTRQLQLTNEELETEVAIRRRAELTLRATLDGVEALYRVTRLSAEMESLPQLLQAVADSVADALGASRTLLILFDLDRREVLDCVQGGFAEPRPIGDFEELMDGLTGWVVNERKPALSSGIEPDPRETDEVRERRNATDSGSIIVVPMSYRGHLFGTLTTIRPPAERDFDERDVDLLVAIANQAAVAIENRRLFEETRQRAEESETLRQAGAIVAGSLAQVEAIERILDQLMRVVPYDSGSVQLLRPGYLEIVGGRGWPADVVNIGHRFPVPGDNPNTAAIDERRTIVLNDARNEHAVFQSPIGYYIRSWVGVPLIVDDRVIGMFSLDSRTPGYFTADRVRLVGAFADQVAIVLEKARLFDETQRRAAELAAANRELESFSYSVSHDLRAPLRSLDGFSRILLDEHQAALNPEARRYLHFIRESAQRMAQLIDDLLAFSRLGRQTVRKVPIQMAPLVRQIAEELVKAEASRRIDWSVGDLPDCHADPALLRQVLVNLISNALKFTRRREVAVVQIGWQPAADGRPAYFVRDNGAGFDMRYAHRLFGVFQRLHRLEEYEGTGVGLALSQRIIQRHGGRIWVEAEADRGATFFFELDPLDPVGRAAQD